MGSLTEFFLWKVDAISRYGIMRPNHKHFAVILVAVLLSSIGLQRAQAENITVAAFGDSLTQGYGLPVQDGLTAQLQTWLDAQNAGITILNAGVSGDTTTGGLQRLDWTLTPDVDAIMITLGGNDMLRGIAPDLTRSNLDRILQIAASKDVPVLLVGLTAASNFGSAYKSEFDAIYPELSQQYETLFVANIFAPLLALGPWNDVIETHMQRDAIHPNAQGVALIVEALGPEVIELSKRAAH